MSSFKKVGKRNREKVEERKAEKNFYCKENFDEILRSLILSKLN
ncbi:MAG: hypothetical protein QXP77_02665 [Candidatus Aenigmatarchaeota archaeon]